MKIFQYGIIICLAFMSCQESGTKLKTSNGYDLVFHKDVATQKAQIGEYAYFLLDVIDDKGNLLQSVRNAPEDPVTQIQDPSMTGVQVNPVAEAISFMGIGDSLSIVIPIDSIPGPIPNVGDSKFIQYNIVIKDIVDQATYMTNIEKAQLTVELEEKALKAKQPEMETYTRKYLEDYKAGALDADMITDETGLQYYIIEEGTGPNAKPGQLVETHYYGYLMNGKSFDNSYQHGKPYPVQLGRKAVIEGWEIGLQKINEGTKAIFVIPYDLGYGANGNPPRIPEQATLLFYIEVGNIYY